MDDVQQAQLAISLLKNADLVALTIPALCEFVWVLTRVYKKSTPEVALALNRLVACSNTRVNQNAFAAGLKVFESGGDFADGAIASEGAEMGADEFVSFDRAAVLRIANSRFLK